MLIQDETVVHLREEDGTGVDEEVAFNLSEANITHAVQAVTLPDGSTAIIQQPLDQKGNTKIL